MQNNDQSQIVGAIIIAGLLIAGAILLKGNTPKTTIINDNNNTNKIDLVNLDIRSVNDEDHILGTRDAKVVIVEYSDLECPFCKNFHTTLQKITKERKDVAWVYRHYPIPALHSKAPHEAEATECAYAQGGNDAFWKYIDRMFAITPSNNGLDEKELMNIADYVGLNSSAFYTCLQSGKYANKVQTSMEEGAVAGVAGTPTSFITTPSNITALQQEEIAKAVRYLSTNGPAVSFDVKGDNIMRLNGALPIDGVNKILDILLK